MESSEIILRCMNGFAICVNGSNLIVSSKRQTETFPISKIQSFVLKEPRALSPGSIVFHTAQSATMGINVGFGIGAALGAEKSFFFQKADMETAVRVRDYIASFQEQAFTPSSEKAQVVSVVDEIRGLKSLLDDGVLTEEEFCLKKRQLLGL